MFKLGRNDLCWCGAGKKYKRCHLQRERQEPVRLQELIDEQNRAGNLSMCMHPDAGPGECVGPIVRAHTIQRAGGLYRIAVGGHVYGFCPDIARLPNSGGLFMPQRIGIKQASTFTGFCATHDSQLFRPIETRLFSGTPEQSALLGYRAVCREMFAKKVAMRGASVIKKLDRGKAMEDQIFLQQLAVDHEAGLRAGLQDVTAFKGAYDSMIAATDFSSAGHYIVSLDRVPDIMCSGVFAPEADFCGGSLQKLYPLDEPVDHVAFSLFANDTGGAAVFSWVKPNPTAVRLSASIGRVPDDQLPGLIACFCFEFFENTFWSPKWWDQLSAPARESVIRSFNRRLEFTAEPENAWLSDVPSELVSWRVTSRAVR